MELPAPFGRYTLLRLLGQGGAGRVYEAELRGPAGFRKRLALKILTDDTSHATAEGLRREARIGGMLKHPNLVDTYDFGEVDGRLYIAMELVDGAPLSAIVKKTGPLPPAVFLDLAGQLCVGIGALHAIAGLVHRDLKPGNVLVDRSGLAKVGDFGVSQAATELAPEGSGTLGYMAPEQLEGATIDARTDVFSLGVVLYEAITGDRLIGGQAHEKAAKTYGIEHHMRSTRALERADEQLRGLGAVLGRCLYREREARPPSAGAVWELLRVLEAPPLDGPSLAWRAAEVAGGVPLVSGQRTPGATTASRLVVGRVPSSAEPFFGRRRESTALAAVLEEARLVTVKGPGGVGKSRLLLHVVHGIRDHFDGGAWWVSLADTHTLAGAQVAIGRAIGTRIGDEDETAAGVGVALRQLGGALLVLDDADAVADGLGRLLARWLEEAPDLRIAVACRSVLHAPGERIVEVGPLDRRAAVELLRHRVAARGVTWDDDEVVAELADRLDRLPLALELAAGRAGTLGARQILERLDDRFRLLGTRGRTTRQATLRAVLESSFASLGPWERDAMAQLSVFRGGFRLEIAEEVVDLSAHPEAPWMLDVVSRLWETSLLRSRDVNGQPRFHLLESIREFAAAELGAAGRAPELRARHARAYVGFDEDHATPGRSSRPMAERVLELDNLIAAWETALASDDAVLASHLALATNAIVRHVAPVRRAIERTTDLLDRFAIPPLLRARLLASRGMLEADDGSHAAAERDLRAAAESYVRLGERWRRAAALNNLGATVKQLGRGDEARAHYEATAEIARSLGALVLEASAEANLGAQDDRRDRAEARFRRAAALLEAAGPDHDPSLDVTVFQNLAVLGLLRNDLDDAASWASRSLEVCRKARLRKRAHAVVSLLAAIAELRGDMAGERAHLEAAYRLAEETRDRDLLVTADLDLARWALRAGDLEEARRRAQHALDRLGRHTAGPELRLAEAWIAEARARNGDPAGVADMAAAEAALRDEPDAIALIKARRGALAVFLGERDEARVRLAELRAGPVPPGAAAEVARLEQALREER